MGTQKNSLNELVLLITQNIWLNWWVRKYLQFYTKKILLSNLCEYSCNIICILGLLAKNAVEAGLRVQPYIKTSLSPGSGVVTYYLRESGVTSYLETLGWVEVATIVKVLAVLVICIAPLWKSGGYIGNGLSVILSVRPSVHPSVCHNFVSAQYLEKYFIESI